MDLCLRVLKERNKSRFDSYSVMNNVLIISHTTFRDCRVHIFSDNRFLEIAVNYSIQSNLIEVLKFVTEKYRSCTLCRKSQLHTIRFVLC